MATTAAAGDWGVGANWVGGVVPTDVAVLAHDMTVSDARTIGNSPTANAGNYVLTLNSGVTLTIQDGGTLTRRGDTYRTGGNARIIVQGGGSLRFDASLAASPSTTSYQDYAADASWIEIAGTSNASRGVITSVTTNNAANGRFTGFADAQNFDFVWGRLSHLGDGNTTKAIASSGLPIVGTVNFENTIVESTVGHLEFIMRSSYGTPSLTFLNTQFQSAAYLTLSGNTNTIALMDTSTSRNDIQFSFVGMGFRDSLISGSSYWAPSTGVSEWQNMAICLSNGATNVIPHPLDDTVEIGPTLLFYDDYGNENAHWTNIKSVPFDWTLRGWVIGGNLGALAGDSDILQYSFSDGTHYATIRNCIKLHEENGYDLGNFVNLLGINANGRAKVEHCTIWNEGNPFGGISFNETMQTDDVICWGRSNLMVSSTPNSTAALLLRYPGTNPIGPGDKWSHNNIYNSTGPSSPWDAVKPAVAYGGSVHSDDLFTGTLAALTTDTYENPQFVDDTRNYNRFANEVAGYTGTVSERITALFAALFAAPNPDDPNFNAAVTNQAVREWISAGYVPQNVAIRPAHDGNTWRGAMTGNPVALSSTALLPHATAAVLASHCAARTF